MGNEVIICVFAILIAIGLYQWWKDYHEKETDINNDNEETMNENHENLAMDMNQVGTRDLFLETLTKIGCQYELGEGDDDRIYFAYQGEYFFANASNQFRYVQIFDTNWGHIELYDIDEFTRLRKAINGSNLENSVITIYTIDEEGNNVDVHCKSTVLFISEIPQIEDYLRLELNEFFRAHQFVYKEMEKLRIKEKAGK